MPIRYSSKELIRIITKDGWYLIGAKGSHHKFRHPFKPGLVVVPHPSKNVHPGTASQILKIAGITGN